MAVLLIGGLYNRNSVPPYPEQIVSGAAVVADKATIMRGQTVWQRYGLMDHGSVWGHGTQRGPDFSAESLHLMGESLRRQFALERYHVAYESLKAEEQALVDSLVIQDIKTNTYDAATGTLTISPQKERAIQEVSDHWDRQLRDGDQFYGFLPGTIPTEQERRDLGIFFVWTAWAAGTNRPNSDLTYTNNWPADRAVGNIVPGGAILWSIMGMLVFLAVLGLIIFIIHRYRFFYGSLHLTDAAMRIATAPLTVSQIKSAKYLVVVVALFILQILFGGLLAHYTVHPGSFFLAWVAQTISYSWAKTWHLQLGIFWIATAWVGSALYLAPLVGNREPRKQGLLVDLLFGAILLVAVGSMVGEVISIKGGLGKWWFLFGHQGWEYLELGRVWQFLLFVGLVAWLVMAYRALAPRLKADRSFGGLTWLYTLSAVGVVGFFAFGFTYNPQTHLSIADYWRWFVVHLWVEGSFEFFAAASGALLLTALGLVTRNAALRAAYLTAILAFAGGIIGTAHHYFWFGAPGFWMALGAVFSSLEPIPLVLLASRAWFEYHHVARQGADFPYRWPLLFLIASSFWNFLGAGVFGFLINLPVINYYEHATYLTANHGHTALFGTYGMLAISLALFVWRGLVRSDRWDDRLLRVSFWGLNGGLAGMFLLTLFPVGVLQVVQAYTIGLWSAKSDAFFSTPVVQFLGQIRIVPDLVIILLGAVPLALFMLLSLRNFRKAEVHDGEAVFPDQEMTAL
jgi:nitric oxide reductase subunit B